MCTILLSDPGLISVLIPDRHAINLRNFTTKLLSVRFKNFSKILEIILLRFPCQRLSVHLCNVNFAQDNSFYANDLL